MLDPETIITDEVNRKRGRDAVIASITLTLAHVLTDLHYLDHETLTETDRARCRDLASHVVALALGTIGGVS